MKTFAAVIMIIFGPNIFALEIDEKLTTRVVDISESRKTILINRGIEDGLAIGDHAKFFVSTGLPLNKSAVCFASSSIAALPPPDTD